MGQAWRAGANALITTFTANTLTVVIPAGAQAGDVMVAGYLVRSATTDPGGQAVISAPSGGSAGAWNPMLYAQQAQSGAVAQAWYKTLTAADPGATLTFTYTGSTALCQQEVLLGAWSGCSTTNPVPTDVSATNATSSATQVLPAINTIGNGQCWIGGLYLGRGPTSASAWSVSAGWTIRGTEAPGGSFTPCGALIDNAAPVTAGPGQGGATLTADQPLNANFLYTFALAPASAAAVTRPNADVTTAGWTPSQTVPGGTPVSSLVADATDTTYVYTGSNPSALTWEAKLPAVAAAPATVRNRGYFGGGAVAGTVVTSLIQGTTVIATRTDTYSGGSPPPTVPTDWVITLTSGQQAAITNLADLRIRCVMTAS